MKILQLACLCGWPLLGTLPLGAQTPSHSPTPPHPAPPDPAEVATMLLELHDADGNQALDEAELSEGLTMLHKHRPACPPRRQTKPDHDRPPPPPPPLPDDLAAELMEQFDTDADGYLIHSELAEAMAALPESGGPPRPPRVPKEG